MYLDDIIFTYCGIQYIPTFVPAYSDPGNIIDLVLSATRVRNVFCIHRMQSASLTQHIRLNFPRARRRIQGCVFAPAGLHLGVVTEVVLPR